MIALVFILDGGNLPTEYTLPLQFLSLSLFINTTEIIDHRKKNKNFFIIGLLGGLAFFFKQTSIGVWISISTYLLFELLVRKRKTTLQQITALIIGFLLIFFGFSVYFLVQSSFREFIDAVFVYNIFYSIKINDFYDRFTSLINLSALVKTSLLHLSNIGIPLMVILLIGKDNGKFKIPKSLLGIILLDILLEFGLINISSFSYPHYYMSLLPSLAFSSGMFMWVILEWIKKRIISKLVITMICSLIIIFSFLVSIREYKMQTLNYQMTPINPVVEFLAKHSDKDDYVLFWGAESGYNFYTRRISPTIYVYQYPLFTIGYTNKERITEFLDDILNKNPKYIIDCNNMGIPLFFFPEESKIIDKKIVSIKSRYEIVTTIDGWVVYERLNNRREQ